MIDRVSQGFFSRSEIGPDGSSAIERHMGRKPNTPRLAIVVREFFNSSSSTSKN